MDEFTVVSGKTAAAEIVMSKKLTRSGLLSPEWPRREKPTPRQKRKC